jgi:DNA helicase HerA-like ATPase
MKTFLEGAATQHHPLRILREFLKEELANEQAKKYDAMRFAGYVLEIGYDSATIITADRFKINVGGIPRNSLLIMTPEDFDGIPLHFTMLRVLESAPTPLSKEVQQTYFELQKRSMPELNWFTQNELQWGALKTAVLGMFYEHPERENTIEFSGDVNNFVSAHKYRVYAPDSKLLDLIVNSLVPEENRFQIGDLRLTECRLGYKKDQPGVRVFVSTNDFKGTRTAMFGKTRLGKSNVVKLIAESLLKTTHQTRDVGQLIFDINGEYANDNPQDGNLSLRSGYPDRCFIYALNPRKNTISSPLKLNFYEQPDKCLPILASLLKQDNRASGYVQAFASIEFPSIEEVQKLSDFGDKKRAIRKFQIYWAILNKAKFDLDSKRILDLNLSAKETRGFNPGFSAPLRQAAYKALKIEQFPQFLNTIDELQRELEIMNRFRRDNPNEKVLISSSGKPTFDADDIALLEFLEPQPGRSGISLIQPYRIYHASNAGDFIDEILKLLDGGQTVILDLGNANPQVMTYFSDELSKAVFNHQVNKFTNNELEKHYIQLYFEEAHNLFPQNEDVTTIYSRFAKEGAKYHLGMVYSTQSPTTVNKDLLAQTENFFIAHLSSQDQVNSLGKVNIAYESLKGDILQAKTPGYMRMLTRSHRFVISVQAKKFVPITPEVNGSQNGSK